MGRPKGAWYYEFGRPMSVKTTDNDDEVIVPPVSVGRRFRQLVWKEVMRADDEVFIGPEHAPYWRKLGEIGEGRQYRPHHSNAKYYAPWSIVRRLMGSNDE